MTERSQRQTATLTEAAAILGVGRTLAYDLARRDQDLVPGVRAFKVGSVWRVSLRQLDRFLNGEAVAEERETRPWEGPGRETP